MIRDTGAWYSWRRWYCIKIPLSKAIRIFSGSLFFYWRFLEQIIIVYLLHNFSRTARHPEAVVGRELGGSSLLDPNLRSNLVAEEEVVDPVSQPVLIVFDKCSCNTKADHLPWSLSLDPCPLILVPCPLILVPWSLFLDPCSLFLDPCSLILVLRSLSLVPYSLILVPVKVPATQKLILDPGPWTLFIEHCSLNIAPWTLFLEHCSLILVP